uniref:ATP synthase F0 subunit 8 n=1 Tax=Tanystylum sp. JZ-2022 TaxID=2992008 RepID=A0A9E7V849_9CHEL|nr:ATP synthase F0 subunit 8 [Tanystylum sp. JZ-2022]
MPQMMPMNWILIFFILTSINLLMLINFYYNKKHSPPLIKQKNYQVNKWKW